MTRRALTVASLALTVSIATASPAAAVEGTFYDSASVGSGWGSATTTVSGGKNSWKVSAYVKDNKAGDDCTFAEIHVTYYDARDLVFARRQVCGAASSTFTASGQIYIDWGSDVRRVYVRVCQNRSALPDLCDFTEAVYVQ